MAFWRGDGRLILVLLPARRLIHAGGVGERGLAAGAPATPASCSERCARPPPGCSSRWGSCRGAGGGRLDRLCDRPCPAPSRRPSRRSLSSWPSSPRRGPCWSSLPLALLLLLGGHWVAAIFLARWGLLVTGTIDNVSSGWFARGGSKLHGALLFFATQLAASCSSGRSRPSSEPSSLAAFRALVELGGRELVFGSPRARASLRRSAPPEHGSRMFLQPPHDLPHHLERRNVRHSGAPGGAADYGPAVVPCGSVLLWNASA